MELLLCPLKWLPYFQPTSKHDTGTSMCMKVCEQTTLKYIYRYRSCHTEITNVQTNSLSHRCIDVPQSSSIQQNVNADK